MVEDQELKGFDHWLMFADFESLPVFSSIHLGGNGITHPHRRNSNPRKAAL